MNPLIFTQTPKFFELTSDEMSRCKSTILNHYPDRDSIRAILSGNDVRTNLKFMFGLEKVIIPIISRFGKFESIQFPLNLRIFESDPQSNQVAYSTDFVHADVWSGAPTDSMNFLFYIEAQDNYAVTAFYPEPSEQQREYRGKYYDAPALSLIQKDNVVYCERPGQGVFFSTFDIHKTIRPPVQDGYRISIDLRVRLSNPYMVNDERVREKDFMDQGIGNPGLGHYWHIAPHAKNYEERIEFELEKAQQIGRWARALREGYLGTSRFHRRY